MTVLVTLGPAHGAKPVGLNLHTPGTCEETQPGKPALLGTCVGQLSRETGVRHIPGSTLVHTAGSQDTAVPCVAGDKQCSSRWGVR